MAGVARDRLFTTLGHLGTRHPWRVLAVVAVLMLLFGALIPGLGVTTSRTGLVDEHEPQQARMNAFFERFGRPDNPVFVVSGGTTEDRRAVVDRLEAALERDPQFAGKVLGRIHPADIAPVALLRDPWSLLASQTEIPENIDPLAMLAGGLPKWLETLASQIEVGLEAQAGSGPEAMEVAAAGLDRLAMAASVFEAYLAQRDIMDAVGSQIDAMNQGIDERGYLVTVGGEYNLVSLFPKITSDEGAELKPLVEHLRSVRDQVMATQSSTTVEADLTGLPSLSVDELDLVNRGLRRSSVATTLGIFALCLLLFRSAWQSIVALAPLLPGVVVTLGFVHYLYDDLNLITSSFVAVLLGLGIDFSVHFIFRRNEQVRAGMREREALAEALRTTGPGIFTGGVTTAAAFLTTATTDFTAYAELGVITAIGLIVIMLATFFLLPPLLAIGKHEDERGKVSPEPPGFSRLHGVVEHGRWPILVAGVVLAIGGAIGLPRIDFDSNYFKFLPDAAESARGLRHLEYDALASPVFAAFSAPSIEAARTKAEQLRELSSVAGVQTPSDLLPDLEERSQGVTRREALQKLMAGLQVLDPSVFQALATKMVSPDEVRAPVQDIVDLLDEARFALKPMGGPMLESATRSHAAFERLLKSLDGLDEAGRARLATIHRDILQLVQPAIETAAAVVERGRYAPSDLPPLFQTRFVSLDGDAVAVYAVPDGQFWEMDVAERFAADVRGVDPEAAGLAMIHVAHNQMVYSGFKRAAGMAVGLILLMLVIDFRSLKDAALALLPTLLGWLWMIGVMVAVGLRFNTANIVAMPLVLGIGIAFGVHLMHRVREYPTSDAVGHGVSLEDVVRGTGGAIVVAAATTMVGFGGLTLGGYGAMISLGTLMVIGISACLLATVFVLPAALLVLGEVE